MSIQLKIGLFLLFLGVFNKNLADTTKELQMGDHAYEKTIKTVILNHPGDIRNDAFQSDAIPLSQTNPLFLEFDDLREDADYYFVMVIHCNADWSRSEMKDIEFLFDYNEFEIQDFEFSIDTRIPYVHYRIRVPKVRLPGNYVLVVYRGNNTRDIILSKRFLVYDRSIAIQASLGLSSGVVQRDLNHQIEFKVNYGSLNISFPTEEIKVVIRQNKRWDNAITGLKPTFVRADLGELEYHHFNFENNFQAGNEFRLFDTRTLKFRGNGVGAIQDTGDGPEVFLYSDKSRGNIAYSIPVNEDLDGQFILENADNGPANIASEYSWIHFHLEHPKLREEVYVAGSFSNWEKSPSYRMAYENNSYNASVLLKQGWYNYMYLVDGNDPNRLEGNYKNTRNQYEILVYFSKQGSRGDLLLGYAKLGN